MRFNKNKKYLEGKKGFIFDLDGTLVDSMMHWRSFDWSKINLEEVYVIMKDLYEEHIPIKRDSLDMLRVFNSLGIKCCIATATRSSVCSPCVSRVGLSPYVEFILCNDDVGKGKQHPDIYLEAARRLGLKVSETVVFEDQLYAATTAKNAGFTVVAIHDKQSEGDEEALRAIADDYIENYSELLEI